jgi:Leucine-rich repeat (LRR) protein
MDVTEEMSVAAKASDARMDIIVEFDVGMSSLLALNGDCLIILLRYVHEYLDKLIMCHDRAFSSKVLYFAEQVTVNLFFNTSLRRLADFRRVLVLDFSLPIDTSETLKARHFRRLLSLCSTSKSTAGSDALAMLNWAYLVQLLPTSVQKMNMRNVQPAIGATFDCSHLVELKELYLHSYKRYVRALPILPPSIQVLELCAIRYALEITDLSHLVCLRELTLHCCDAQSNPVPILPPSLELLNLDMDGRGVSLDFAHLSILRVLRLANVLFDKHAPVLPTSLEALDLTSCVLGHGMMDFSTFYRLRELRLPEYPISVVYRLPPSIELLRMIRSGAGSNTEVDFTHLPRLRELRYLVKGKYPLPRLPPSVEELLLVGFDFAYPFLNLDFSHLILLRKLNVSHCYVSVPPLLPTSLTELDLSGNLLSNLPEPLDLSHLIHLHTVNIRASKLTSLPLLPLFVEVVHLDSNRFCSATIRDRIPCPGLEARDFSHLPLLRWLAIDACHCKLSLPIAMGRVWSRLGDKTWTRSQVDPQSPAARALAMYKSIFAPLQ